MPLIPLVGRKGPRARLILITMYTVLILGGITMVTPFLFMVTRASATRAGIDRLSIMPLFLVQRNALLVDYVAVRYGSLPAFTFSDWAALYAYPQRDATDWRDLNLETPAFKTPTARVQAQQVADDLNAFHRAMATDPEGTLWTLVNHEIDPRVEALGLEFLQRHIGGTSEAVATRYGLGPMPIERLIPGAITQESFSKRITLPPDHPRIADYRAFKSELAETTSFETGPAFVVVFPDALYQRHLQGLHPSLADLNQTWGSDYRDWSEIHFTRRPASGREAADRLAFVRRGMPISFLRLRGSEYAAAYRAFLRTQYAGDIAACNESHETEWPSFDAIPVPDRAPLGPVGAKRDWVKFFEQKSDPAWVDAETSADHYVRFLRTRYESSDALNAAHGTAFSSFDEARPPLAIYDGWCVELQPARLRWHLLTMNYRAVFRFLITRGNAGINTVVLIFLTLIGTFTVNPMAAYALSRFRLPYANRVLLFLLATMAFPAEVAMIPNFLITKNLGLLNTYAALILPGVANGMNIFLLKGFFDSLPKELYEAATLDGASEMRCFFSITLPLSQPIMAYMAFMTFTATYASWGWALLICQDPAMWTIAVELFQFQVAPWNPAALKFASFVVASIPTLVAFLFCQRIILRGIVVPTEK